MKKLFIVLAVASLGFVACNNESKTEETVTDSAANKVEETANAAQDSVKNIADSAANKIDSTAKAATDSIKK